MRSNPGLVSNLDWLLYLALWNPNRLAASEFSYEAYHAAIGLLSVWHQHILDEADGGADGGRGQAYGLWLTAVEQVRSVAACINCLDQLTASPRPHEPTSSMII